MVPTKLNPSIIATLIAILLGIQLTGCNADPRARREMALLRAEILDLEDQFYMMKSRYQSANDQLMACQGHAVNQYGDTTISEEGFVESSTPVYEEYVEGEFVDNRYIIDDCIDCGPGEVIYDSPQYTGRYTPHATPDLRGSAKRLFGRNATQRIRQPSAPKRGFGLGLFSGRGLGLGLFNRNKAVDEFGTNLDSMMYEPQFAEDRPLPIRRNSQLASSALRAQKTKPATQQFDPDPLDLEIDYDVAKDDNYDSGVVLENGEVDPDIVFDNEFNHDNHSVATPNLRSASSESVTRIELDKRETSGEDVDGEPGHEGVVVLIQPRNDTGQIVNASGDVTVSLIEPTANGEEQRIGLWKFTSDEVALFETSNRGYLLRLPWEQNVPQSNELLVYVRYWTEDGRRLETSTRLSIDPPSSKYSARSNEVEGWTKRDPNWNLGTPERSQASSLAQDPVVPNLNANDDRGVIGNRVKATPASTTIKRPAWRPSR